MNPKESLFIPIQKQYSRVSCEFPVVLDKRRLRCFAPVLQCCYLLNSGLLYFWNADRKQNYSEWSSRDRENERTEQKRNIWVYCVEFFKYSRKFVHHWHLITYVQHSCKMWHQWHHYKWKISRVDWPVKIQISSSWNKSVQLLITKTQWMHILFALHVKFCTLNMRYLSQI